MRKLLLAVVALVSAVVLSSCSLSDFLSYCGSCDKSKPAAEERMLQIADALQSNDAAALKAMFSSRAIEQATDFDERLDSLLSALPQGSVDWSWGASGTEARHAPGKKTELMHAYFSASVDGTDYSLFFADFTTNEVFDPDNVGLYALGFTHLADVRGAGPGESFFDWGDSFEVAGNGESGYPGIYIAPDATQLSLKRMGQLVSAFNTQDVNWLRFWFSEHARDLRPAHLETGFTSLFELFPDGNITWDEVDAAPIVREKADGDKVTTLLLSTYRVSAGGIDYWVSFADFRDNATDPSNVGLYAIGVAPRTEAGDSAAEQELFDWLDTFDVDASAPPQIFIVQ